MSCMRSESAARARLAAVWRFSVPRRPPCAHAFGRGWRRACSASRGALALRTRMRSTRGYMRCLGRKSCFLARALLCAPAGRTRGFATRSSRVKDAICDRLREVRGERPDVNVAHPDIAIDVRIHEGKATVSVDLSGTPLNDRAYFGRNAPDTMPLLCSYAAALLAYAKWGERAGEGYRFVDALAESRSEDEKSRGLSVLEREARAIVLDEAPGAARSRWGFSSWGRFDEETWNTLLDEADERAERAQESLRPLDASAPQLVAAVLIDPANDNAVSAAGDAAFVRAAADAPARSVFACIGGGGAAERFGVEPSL